MQQPSFFARPNKAGAHLAEQVILLALGEFQARGKVLEERELPLDRLLGAVHRAAIGLDVEELTDEQVVTTLKALGASVQSIPFFAAKHPYRVTVHPELAEASRLAYAELLSQKRISEIVVNKRRS